MTNLFRERADRPERRARTAAVVDSRLRPLRRFFAQSRLTHQVVQHSRRTMAAVFAGLIGSASLIGLVTFVVPHPPIDDTTLRLSLTLTGVPAAIAVLWLARHVGDRLPIGVFDGLLVALVAMIGLGSWSGRDSPTAVGSAAFFVWVGLYLGYFFTARRVLLHLGWVAVCVGVLFHVLEGADWEPVTVLVLGIVLVATGVTFYLESLLAQRAVSDPLTGLLNRRAIEVYLTRQIARAQRAGTPLSIGIADIDYLKAINDSAGHQAGDAVIVALARRWRAHLSGIGILGRYGGDEFVLVFPRTDGSAATEVCEALRGLGEWQCSIGVVQWRAPETAEAIVARADVALYEAKAQGRNQVQFDAGA